jgi:hypothetical protein
MSYEKIALCIFFHNTNLMNTLFEIALCILVILYVEMRLQMP